MNKESIQQFLKSKKGSWILLVLGVLGILFIFLSDRITDSDQKEPDRVVEVQTTSVETYASALEEKLGEMVRNIAGAGNCMVMITVDTGVEYIYAQDIKNNSQQIGTTSGTTEEKNEMESEYLVINGETVLVTEKQPVVKGAVVVCEGAGSAAVRQRVLEVVTTALGIRSEKVCITEME